MKSQRTTSHGHPVPIAIGIEGWSMLRHTKHDLRVCLFILSWCVPIALFSQNVSIELNSGWEFRQVGTETWYPATVPGTVHTDLLANGLIEDPFKDNKEIKQQWIEKVNWVYRINFDVPEMQFSQKHHELNFEGLDTYAEVVLNGEQILDANNMFRSWRVDVTDQIKEAGNELHIVFTSPLLKNDSIARANVKLPGGSDTSEYPVWPYTRKAAYHFGWDWAPRFVTSGIWKEVSLESWGDFKLWDVYYDIYLDEDGGYIEVDVNSASSIQAVAILEFDGNRYEDTISALIQEPYFEIEVDNPKLWWPNGSGESHLYEAKLWFVRGDDTLAFDSQRIGFRTIELINEPDSIGTSFYFKVNGQPIFMKGANYVPQDVFLPRVKPEQYERLLNQVKDAGMNMIRVWGGGVYERDIFYDLCDEYGILVWQDFMFAGTMYPFDSDWDFWETSMLEIEEQLFRMRKHACLAIYCGNNEIEVAWKNWGWQSQYGYSAMDSLALWKGYSEFFEGNIVRMIGEKGAGLGAGTPYVSTSPQSNWGTAENFNHGSMHYWGVWHGDDGFNGFNQNVGRFMVEWGFQSFPDYEMLEEYVSPEFLKLDSEVMKNRQKSYVGNSKIIEFMSQYALYGGSASSLSFKDYVYNSQWVQALGYEQAVKAHLGKQPHCMGTLLWQLNDCWPGPSWSILNYDGKPKPAYEVVKKAFTP